MTDVEAAFRHAFGRAAQGVWTAPGRINLIGEHTDYNDGFVLPMALPHVITAAAARRPDGVLRLESRQANERVETHIDNLKPEGMSGWAAYPAGVIWALLDAGAPVSGLDILIDGAVPPGAGLSSSAALECVTALATTHLHGTRLDNSTLARIAQHAENDFVGMPCGIMDQFACLLSSHGHGLFLDTRSLDTRHIPINLDDHDLVLLVIDTRAPHRLVDGEYAVRRRTCEQAATQLGVKALRDIEPEQLEHAMKKLSDHNTALRVRHVVTENARVLKTVQLLRTGKLPDIGPVLTESHASLRHDYEVTVPELDTAVEAVLAAGALGARMTGGGFGGCVIALVASDKVNACTAALRRAFHAQSFDEPAYFRTTPSVGARRLR